MTLRFDRALPLLIGKVIQFLSDLAPEGEAVVVVRDVVGRLRVFIDRNPPNAVADGADVGPELPLPLRKFIAECANDLGAFVVPQGVLFWRDGLVAPRSMYEAPESYRPLLAAAPENLRVLDRLVTGREWLLPSLHRMQPGCPRAVFFGLKGGVGRTTALALLARRFSEAGKKVLVVDLDLESPGLGPTLLPDIPASEGDTCMAGWPTFGVADWFVEDAVGQADDELLLDMVAQSPLTGRGEILVVPACGGLIDQDYIAKPARVYLDLPSKMGRELFGDRLERLLDQLEARFVPDVILLDSRAGMHDISSTTLMRLRATGFMFAVDTPQTWDGYRHLFKHLQLNPDRLRDVRQRLKLVAALIPTSVVVHEFLKSFCEHSEEVFSALYDVEAAEDVGQTEVFNFAVHDPDAPHYPIIIRAHDDFALFQPQANSVQLEADNVNFAFGRFLADAASMLFPEE